MNEMIGPKIHATRVVFYIISSFSAINLLIAFLDDRSALYSDAWAWHEKLLYIGPEVAFLGAYLALGITFKQNTRTKILVGLIIYTAFSFYEMLMGSLYGSAPFTIMLPIRVIFDGIMTISLIHAQRLKHVANYYSKDTGTLDDELMEN